MPIPISDKPVDITPTRIMPDADYESGPLTMLLAYVGLPITAETKSALVADVIAYDLEFHGASVWHTTISRIVAEILDSENGEMSGTAK